MRRSNYGHSWKDFIIGWSVVLIVGPLGLIFLGFVLKLIWNCFMVGWEAV